MYTYDMKHLGLQEICRKVRSKITVMDLIFSVVFALVIVIGYVLSHNPIADITVTKKEFLGFLLISIVIWVISLFVLLALKNYAGQAPVGLRRQKNFLVNVTDKKLWVVTSVVIFLCYLPIIILSSSELTYDSWNIISQSTGVLKVTNAHPVIFTGIVSLFMGIGNVLGGIGVGIVLYSLFQSAILSMIFARVIVWQRQVGLGAYGIIATLFFYAILPVNAFAGTILWKDILFAGIGLLLLIKLWEMFVQGTRFLTKKNITLYVLIAFTFCILRNNALYAYVLFTACILVINRRVLLNKPGLIAILSPVLLSVVYLFSTSLVVGSASSVESMSVPLQQIARTVKYHSASINIQDKNTIDEILPYNKIDQAYNPGLSDPVKWVFNNEQFSQNKSKYIGLWFKLFAQYPKTYIASFLYNTYGYVYPFVDSHTTTDIVLNNKDQINALDGYSDVSYQSGGKKFLSVYREIVSTVFGLTRNIGFYTCLTLLAIYLSIVRRNRALLGVFILLFCLYVSVIFGPVNGEFRYLYLFVVAAPLLITAPFVLKKTK